MTEPHYPQPASQIDRTEPVPRRIRAELGGVVVLDTTRALYLWEWPFYPQYLIPFDDLDPTLVTVHEATHELKRGTVVDIDLAVGETTRPRAGHRYEQPHDTALTHMVRLDWDALEAWYEEDEPVFVHPRNPYVRVDALRSTRHVQVALDGQMLADSRAAVMVFETGLPTRYYLDRSAVDFTRLVPSDTVTACPYKGRTTAYWSVSSGGTVHPDLAWSYDFPTRQLLPVAGLVAFYDEQVDVTIDGVSQPRPVTHFSR